MNLTAVGAQIRELQNRSRTLKTSLTAPGSGPSTAAIQERVVLQERIRTRERIAERLQEIRNQLAKVAADFASAMTELKGLPVHALSPDDRGKLGALRTRLVEQLGLYGFSTFRPEDIDISPDSYRPVNEGFEMGFEISASDAIRLKWAYQIALLETALEFGCSGHPGLLVFDEPRQQETERVSLAGLLGRAASAGERGAQIVFATSEERAELEPMLRGLKYKIISFDGHVISRNGEGA